MEIAQFFSDCEDGFRIGDTVMTDDGKVGNIIRCFDTEYRLQLKDGTRFWVNRQHLRPLGNASQSA